MADDFMRFGVGGKFMYSFNHVEGITFDYWGVPLLTFHYDNPTEKEIYGAREGRLEIGIYERDGVIFFPIKCPNAGGYMDCAFNGHLYLQKYPELDPFSMEAPGPGNGCALTVLMVDTNGDIIKSIRSVGMGNKWTHYLIKCLQKQKETPFDEDKFNLKVSEVYGRLNSRDLFERADIVYRVGCSDE